VKKIEIENLYPGMKFSSPLFIDDDNVILQPGIELKQKEIDLLKKWNIQAIYTEGDLITNQVEKSHPYNYSDIMNIEDTALDFYSVLIEQLDSIFIDIWQERDVVHKRVDDIVKSILDQIENNHNSLINLIFLSNKDVNKLTVNSINSAILTAIVGKHMKMVSYRLIQLTIGALFHDVGLMKVPKEILEKKGKLTQEERDKINTHPLLGYNIILKNLKYPEEIAQIGLYHQERWDGTGYPNGLTGEQIPIGARIVAVAEAYEAMVNKRAYRDEMMGYKAMKQLLSGNGRQYDPGVLKTFLSCVGIYPIGTLVRLNDASIAKIIKINSKVPLRPKVDIIIDKHGYRLQEASQIDLNIQQDIFIIEPFNPNELEAEGTKQ
jgi:HD-GYP domain-containing protein (c-di-GMP phosphodiesterase class II)